MDKVGNELLVAIKKAFSCCLMAQRRIQSRLRASHLSLNGLTVINKVLLVYIKGTVGPAAY